MLMLVVRAGANFSAISGNDANALRWDKNGYSRLMEMASTNSAKSFVRKTKSTEYWDEKPSEAKIASMATYLQDVCDLNPFHHYNAKSRLVQSPIISRNTGRSSLWRNIYHRHIECTTAYSIPDAEVARELWSESHPAEVAQSAGSIPERKDQCGVQLHW